MNQELATLRPNEYSNSNNTILKSQKVLNSAANFHLKTEHADKPEEDHKSPEQRGVEFRETTWRKPRMPYNKFPDAFHMRQKKYLVMHTDRALIRRSWMTSIRLSSTASTRKSRNTSTPSAWYCPFELGKKIGKTTYRPGQRQSPRNLPKVPQDQE